MWHFRHSNNVLVLCALILCAGFMLQFKVLYNNHQKHLRIQEIEQRMTDLAVSMRSVERVANTTSMLINRLQKTVKRPVVKNRRRDKKRVR